MAAQLPPSGTRMAMAASIKHALALVPILRMAVIAGRTHRADLPRRLLIPATVRPRLFTARWEDVRSGAIMAMVIQESIAAQVRGRLSTIMAKITVEDG
ncbi:hypothetical protein DUP91_25230 [Salmonella enterica subsp. enterica]|nr:hypothetical protein [Salmonella enterica subsp. enterica]